MQNLARRSPILFERVETARDDSDSGLAAFLTNVLRGRRRR